ncbi:MAG TPA: hypothetical protein VIJ96_02910 [Acidothermaceae bacterium]
MCAYRAGRTMVRGDRLGRRGAYRLPVRSACFGAHLAAALELGVLGGVVEFGLVDVRRGSKVRWAAGLAG